VTSRSRSERDDQAVFEALSRKNYAAVLAYALRRTGRPGAEDAAAETFLIAWRRRNELVGDPLPWLIGVARRVLANQRRSTTHYDAIAERVRTTAQEVEQWENERQFVLDAPMAAALSSLRTRDREALMLSAWEGLSPRQAAVAVGCSASTFRVRLHRAKKRLAQALAEVETDETAVIAARQPAEAAGSKG